MRRGVVVSPKNRRYRVLEAAPGASRRTKNYLSRRDIEVVQYRGNFVLVGDWFDSRVRPLAWLPKSEVIVSKAKKGKQ